MRADDTTFLGAAALARGLSTVLVANRVLTVKVGNGSRDVAFAWGVAHSTQQGTAALLEEQDVVRSLLKSTGIGVPRSKTHTFGARDSALGQTMEQFAHGVQLRPAWQSARVFSVASIDDLGGKVQALRSIAGRHALRLNRPQSRFMIEEATKPIGGPVIVAHGDVVGGRSDLDSGAAESAVRAVQALPGIEVARVRLVIRPSDGRVLVAGLSPWPRFAEFGPEAHSVAGRILAAELRRLGVDAPDSLVEDRTVELVIRGVPHPPSVAETLSARLNSHHALRPIDHHVGGDTITVRVQGSCRDIAELADELVGGGTGGVIPLSVEMRSIEHHITQPGTAPAAMTTTSNDAADIHQRTLRLLRQFRGSAIDSYLVERAALAYGFETTRFHRSGFIARDTPGLRHRLGYHDRGTMLTSRASRTITDSLRRLYGLLAAHDIPLVEHRFAASELPPTVDHDPATDWVTLLPVMRSRRLLAALVSRGSWEVQPTHYLGKSTAALRIMPGRFYRVLVVADKAIMTMEATAGGLFNVTAPEAVAELARRATQVVPGLGHALVDIAAPEQKGAPHVLDIDVRPSITAIDGVVSHRQNDTASHALIRGHLEKDRPALLDWTESVQLTLQIEGGEDRERVVEELAAWSGSLDLTLAHAVNPSGTLAVSGPLWKTALAPVFLVGNISSSIDFVTTSARSAVE